MGDNISKAVTKRVAQLEPLVGFKLAKDQANWELRHRIRQVREEKKDVTLRQIGKTLGLSGERVRSLQCRADRENKRGKISPLESYLGTEMVFSEK